VLAVVSCFAVALVVLVPPEQAQVLAAYVFFCAPLLNVIEVLNPAENNFFVYTVLPLLGCGVMAAIRAPRRIDLLGWLLLWLLGSAIYTTLTLRPEPIYGLLGMPLGSLAAYLLVRHGTPAGRRAFMAALLVWAGVEAGIAILQTVFNVPGFARWDAIAFSEPRNYLALIVPGIGSVVRMATGTFTHFNQLSALLALVAPIALWRWLDRRTLARGLYTALVGVGLICTFSRGGLLGALVGVLVLVFWLPQNSALRQVRLWAGVSGVSGAVVALGSAIGQYVTATQSVGSRYSTWIVVLANTIADPVRLMLGAGLGFYASGFLRQQYGTALSVHSTPLQLLAETGLVGFALATVAVFRACLAGVRRGDPFSLALSAAVIAFVLHQTVDNAFLGQLGSAVVGTLALLGVRLADNTDGQPQSTLPRDEFVGSGRQFARAGRQPV
jgi:hypothetical protein